MKNKLLTIMVALSIFGLAGCGGSDANTSSGQAGASEQEGSQSCADQVKEKFNNISVNKGGEAKDYTWDGDKYCEAAEKISGLSASFNIIKSVFEGEKIDVKYENYITLGMENRSITIPLDVQDPENQIWVVTKGKGQTISRADKAKLTELIDWLKQNGVEL